MTPQGLLRSPREYRGHRVIPDDSDGNTGKSGNQPRGLVGEHPACNADIRDCTRGAYQIEAEPAPQQALALQPLIAIGQDIVQKEIRCNGGKRCSDLGRQEAGVEHLEQQRENKDMNANARSAIT